MHSGGLDGHECQELLWHYIPEDELVIFVDSRHAVHCSISEAVGHIERFMKIGRVRVANCTFTSKILMDPIGIGQGYDSRAN